MIPNDDDCKSCKVLFSEINALQDVYSVNCKKLESEIEKSKKLESSFALGFALHDRVLDALILTKKRFEKSFGGLVTCVRSYNVLEHLDKFCTPFICAFMNSIEEL